MVRKEGAKLGSEDKPLVLRISKDEFELLLSYMFPEFVISPSSRYQNLELDTY